MPSYGIGNLVEVMDLDDGFKGSYYAAVIIDTMPGRRKVRYNSLKNDAQTGPLEEIVPVSKLRPYDPEVSVEIELGDIVDARFNGGWWLGRYERKDGDKYVVHFENAVDNQRYMSFTKANLRIHKEFLPKTPTSWGFLKRYK